MEVRHQGERSARTLASDVRIADGLLTKGLGLMGKSPLGAHEAMVFRFRRSAARRVHTLFVRAPIDVLWIDQEEVTAVETIPPWRFGGRAKADTIVELPVGGAKDVDPGDHVWLARPPS